MIPKTMNAYVLKRHGDLDALEWHEDWPVPEPSEHQVLIKVAACGLNNTDINTRSGWYSKAVTEATSGDGYTEVGEEDPSWGGAAIQFPRIQGADVCGHVVAVGSGADAKLIGKRVITDNWMRDWDDPFNKDKTGYFGSEADGGYAQYCVADHRNIGVIENDQLTDTELATFSCSYNTAEGMLSRAQVGEGDIVLITGASGGVGSANIQLAKRRGAKVVALASESKHEILRDLGADVVLPRDGAGLVEALKAEFGRDTVDVIADVVGGASFSELIEVLRRGGHYTVSGAIAGPIVDLDLRTLYLNDLTFHGSTVNDPQTFKDLVSYIENGELRALVAKTFPLRDLYDAQTAFTQKAHVGNIVVVP